MDPANIQQNCDQLPLDFWISVISVAMSLLLFTSSMLYLVVVQPHHEFGTGYPWYDFSTVGTSLGILTAALQFLHGYAWCTYTSNVYFNADRSTRVALQAALGIILLITIILFSLGIHHNLHTYFDFRLVNAIQSGTFFVASCGINWVFCFVAIVVLQLKIMREEQLDE